MVLSWPVNHLEAVAGAWFEDFDKLKDPHDFTSYNGVKEQGDAITKESRKLVLAETNEFTLVKIPYGKGNFYMLVALPSGDAKIGENSGLSQVKQGPARSISTTPLPLTLLVEHGPFIDCVNEAIGSLIVEETDSFFDA